MKIVCLSVFIILTTGITLFLFPKSVWHEHLTPIFKDQTIPTRIAIITNLDHGGSYVWMTRMFHNKATLVLEDFFVNISQSTDLTYVHSLTKNNFFYRENEAPTPILPIWELPFLILSVIVIIRTSHLPSWYKLLPFAVILTLGISGVFLPYENPVKLIPFVLTLRTIEFLGIWEIIIFLMSLRSSRSNPPIRKKIATAIS